MFEAGAGGIWVLMAVAPQVVVKRWKVGSLGFIGVKCCCFLDSGALEELHGGRGNKRGPKFTGVSSYPPPPPPSTQIKLKIQSSNRYLLKGTGTQNEGFDRNQNITWNTSIISTSLACTHFALKVPGDLTSHGILPLVQRDNSCYRVRATCGDQKHSGHFL